MIAIFRTMKLQIRLLAGYLTSIEIITDNEQCYQTRPPTFP